MQSIFGSEKQMLSHPVRFQFDFHDCPKCVWYSCEKYTSFVKDNVEQPHLMTFWGVSGIYQDEGRKLVAPSRVKNRFCVLRSAVLCFAFQCTKIPTRICTVSFLEKNTSSCFHPLTDPSSLMVTTVTICFSMSLLVVTTTTVLQDHSFQ